MSLNSKITTIEQLPTRIFVDASHTFASGKNSGIERVVRSIVAECDVWCEREGIPAPQLVTHHGNCFFPIESTTKKLFSHLARLESNIRSVLPKLYLSVAEKLCKWTASPKLNKWLLPKPGHLGAFKLMHNVYGAIVRRRLPWVQKPVQSNQTDLYLLPDAYWARRGVWNAAAKAREQGATIVTLIYDLIPLTHPQYVGTKRMQGFKQYLHHAIENSDLLVAISKTVQEDVKEYIRLNRSHFRRIPKDVQSFTLGAELNLVQGQVRPAFQELFTCTNEESPGTGEEVGHRNPYLMVATFDPRKNHHYLLDVFDRIWETRNDLKLCLIGRVGSLCEDVIERINNHPRLNQQLFSFNDVKDCELQYCYKYCRGVIFPSIVEGFGLPIVESLWFGKRTFASNTPIHREVGQKDCVYFDLESPESLVHQIEAWEAVADTTHSLPTRKPTSWEESSRQLVDQCLVAYDKLRRGELNAADQLAIDRSRAA